MWLPERGVVCAPFVTAEWKPAPVLLEAETRFALERECDSDLGRRNAEPGQEPRRLERPELVLVEEAIARDLPAPARLAHDPPHDCDDMTAGARSTRQRALPHFDDAKAGLDAPE